jgi:hypothetical protein
VGNREWWLLALNVVIAAVWAGLFVALVLEVARGERELGSQLASLIILRSAACGAYGFSP